jgi:hypothetical protein
LSQKPIASSAGKFWSVMAGDANRAGAWKIFKSITSSGGADWVMIRLRILLLFVPVATRTLTEMVMSRKIHTAQNRNSRTGSAGYFQKRVVMRILK